MKKRNVQVLLILIALGISILFSSTGNAMGIDERTLVHAMGVDFSDGEYNVSMQIFKSSGAGTDTPVDVSQSNMRVVKAKGKTVSEAINVVQNELGRDIFMGHLQLIVFGDTVDFSKPEELFAFCLKDKNIYLGVKLCMADKKAEDIMNTQITSGTMTAESFVQTVEKNVKNSTTIDCELLDFLSCINSPQYIAMPILSVKEEEKSEETGSSKSEESQSQPPEPIIEIKETALIKGGKVIEDRLSQTESQGIAWLTKQAEKSALTFELGDEMLSATITDDGSRVWLSNEDGKIYYNAKITVVAHVTKDITTGEESKTVSQAIEKKLNEYYSSAIKKAFFDNKADIFGIWKMIRHSYPKGYLEYKDRLDELYNSVDFSYETDVRVE